MRSMHARLCVHRPHACRTATMRYNALRCLHAYALFTKARTSCIPSERPIVHYYQAVGTDEGSTPLHCSSLYRMAQCMKACLACYFNSISSITLVVGGWRITTSIAISLALLRPIGSLDQHTYLTGKQFWSWRGFFQGEALALHSAWADPCDYCKRR